MLILAPIVWAGKISYSFYSFQLLVLLFMESFHAKIVEAAPALADNRLLLVASFIVLMVLSAAGYHLIEEPMRQLIKRRMNRKSRAAESTVTAAAA